MQKPVVISWADPDSLAQMAHLREDCARLDLDFFGETSISNLRQMNQIWAYKPRFIRTCLERFPKVIYCNSETRLHQKIPMDWLHADLLIPTLSPKMPIKNFLRYHTGFMIWSREHIALLDAWIRVTENWDLANAKPHEVDDRPFGGGVYISDAAALMAAIAVLDMKPLSPALTWRCADQGELLRTGGIVFPQTIVTVGILHLWSQPHLAWNKHIYYLMYRMHFSGDLQKVEQYFSDSNTEDLTYSGWTFSRKNNSYAPSELFLKHAKNWEPYSDAPWDDLTVKA